MQEFVNFLTKNWILASLFLLTAMILLQQYWSQHRFGIQSISTEEAVTLINRDQAMVLNIRSSEAYAAGHCMGALSIAHNLLDKKISILEKHKARPFIVVCESGHRAKESAAFLKTQGFNVFVFEGGMQQWRANSLPIVR